MADPSPIPTEPVPVTSGPARLVPENAPGEGIYVYIQTKTCRRLVVAEVFRNKKPDIDRVVCCDICNPELLERCPSAPTMPQKRRAVVRKCAVNLEVVQELYRWRAAVKKKRFAGTMYQLML
ncbi:hypothetical protein K523DRAFT_358843 [Schizophyllum commune Tattone D]|nr:hypothetical protein K523DRAFT_358843 [Schizophyllum commune Tattone D]